MLLAIATVAGAIEVPGRPGQLEMNFAVINVDSGLCFAVYAIPNLGNTGIGNTGVFPYVSTIKVTQNKNTINASYKFTDTSGIFELNAEVGYIDQVCTMVMDGNVYVGGSGHVVAAENHKDAGGNSTITCKFSLK